MWCEVILHIVCVRFCCKGLQNIKLTFYCKRLNMWLIPLNPSSKDVNVSKYFLCVHKMGSVYSCNKIPLNVVFYGLFDHSTNMWVIIFINVKNDLLAQTQPGPHAEWRTKLLLVLLLSSSGMGKYTARATQLAKMASRIMISKGLWVIHWKLTHKKDE